MPTKIEWAEETWNPITGCTPVSEGCKNCYAKRMARRLAGRHGYPEYPKHFDVALHPEKLLQPLHWRKPRRIFVCSMSDLFHEEIEQTDIADIWNVMRQATWHTFLVLTKRPQGMFDYMMDYWLYYGLSVLPNVWLGVTTENQRRADERIPILLKTPAKTRFISVEPLLGPMVIEGLLTRKLHWLICGAETGPSARRMDLAWARELRDECQLANVPFFYKRGSDGSRLLDGREWNEYPKVT